MHSFEGRATITVDEGREPLEATVIVDDVTSSTWVGIICVLEGSHAPHGDGEAHVVLRNGPRLGATARLMVPVEGLPTLRGRSRFTHESESCATGT